MILPGNIIVRLKALFAHLTIGAVVVIAHPDLLSKNWTSLLLLLCYLVLAFNNAAVGKFKERS